MSGLPDTILKGGHQRTKQSLVPIGPVVSEMTIFWISSPFLFLVTATMLVGGRDCRTQFWKGITHVPFHQSLVSSGQVVSEENMLSNCVRTDDRRKEPFLPHGLGLPPGDIDLPHIPFPPNKKIVYFLQSPYLFTIDRLFQSIFGMFRRADVGGRFGRRNRLVAAHFALY